jgi:hypothetical protein
MGVVLTISKNLGDAPQTFSIHAKTNNNDVCTALLQQHKEINYCTTESLRPW